MDELATGRAIPRAPATAALGSCGAGAPLPEAQAARSSCSWNCGTRIRPCATFRRSVLFQWFLMLLSVRPGSALAILAQAFPCTTCCVTRIMSSWGLQSVCLISGFR